MGKTVRVLVVDDSPLCRDRICGVLSKDPDIVILGTSGGGKDAIARVVELKPDVITLDVEMPGMDGFTAAEQIMLERPTPILMLTDPESLTPALSRRALDVGALALQVKPLLGSGAETWKLAHEVKLLSSVRVIRRRRGSPRPPEPAELPGAPVSNAAAFARSPIDIIAIASSTGGPQVIHKLFSELPQDFPAPILVVQHIDAAFTESLAGWLGESSKLVVHVARDGAALSPGEVLIAPPGCHLVVTTRGRATLRQGQPKDGHMPSGSLLLESVARVYGRRAVGVVLTGMGIDGAEGLAEIRAVGGPTVAQSEASCVVFGMPGAAMARKVVDHVVDGDELSRALLCLARGEPVSGT